MIKSIVICCTIINVLLVQGECFSMYTSPPKATSVSAWTSSALPRHLRQYHANIGALLAQRGGGSREESSTSHENEDETNSIPQDEQKKNQIEVSSSIELPFSAEIAFDAFSNLPRQATWSSWLKSVEYISEDLLETKWTMKSVLGISYSWNAVSTRLERPYLIEWESTRGLKNWGRVQFIPRDKDATSMELTLTFVAPRILARFFRKRGGGLSRMVQKRIVGRTLRNFRRVVLAHDVPEEKAQNATERLEMSGAGSGASR